MENGLTYFWQKYASSVMTKTLDDQNKKERLIAAKKQKEDLKSSY